MMFKVFKYNLTNHPSSLDPAFAKSLANITVCNQLFNTLVALDENGNLQPDIARKWEISSDGLRYTFHLHNNIMFHEHSCFTYDTDRLLTAFDVKYSLERLNDSSVNSPGSWVLDGKLAQNESIHVLDDSTLSIKLSQPFQPFLSLLTTQYCSIVPETVINCLGSEYKNNPIGSGPFLFKRWIKNQNIFLNRNQDYYGEMGDLVGVKVSFIKDRKIAFLEMLNGSIDYFSGLESTFISQMLEKSGEIKAEHDDRIKLIKSPFLNTEYIGFNLDGIGEKHPLSNKLFRRALNAAIDKQQLVDVLRNSIGEAATNGFAPPTLYTNKSLIPSIDNISAKELLIQSGISATSVTELEINTNAEYQDLMLFIAKEWEKLGLRVKVNLLESSVLREGMRNGNIHIFRASWIGDYPDIENFMSLFYSKNGAPPNYSRFKNREFDILYDQVNLEKDLYKREEIYSQMEHIILSEMPVIPLFYDQSSNFYSTSIQNPSNNLMNIPNVKDIIKTN